MKKFFATLVALMAVVTVSAQDLQSVYNEAAAAYNAKDYATAVAKFEQIIAEGMDVEGASSLVATAQQTLPKCYFQMGRKAAAGKDYDTAIVHLNKALELAELAGDMAQVNKTNQMIASVYTAQGGAAYNAKDYATAVAIFEKGYAANPNNTKLALFLAMSYCELGEFEKGMDVYEGVASKTHPKYAEDAAKAKADMALYTNNKVAALQGAGDFDGIIALADAQLAKNPASALFQKVRLQAYLGKKDYQAVIANAEAAAAAQVDAEDQSDVYFLLGAAHNALSHRDQAIAAFKKVTAGTNLANAQAALAELNK